jgi:aldehyde:ferredoxin oxidoreductase
LLDTLGLCQFVWGPAWTLYGPSETVAFMRAVTGWAVSLDELMKVGKRRVVLMRLFNAREGFTRQDDRLPEKFFQPLLGGGPTGGVAIDRQEFEAALDLYYALLGFTPDGIPTHASLVDSGVAWAAEYLPA